MTRTDLDNARMLLEPLERFRGRVRRLAVASGVGPVLAWGVAAVLAAFVADYLLDLPGLIRLVMLLAVIGWVGWLAYRRLIVPAFSKFGLDDAAGKLEEAFPQFDDRLRSGVNIIRGQVPGAEEMKRRVVAQAGEMLRSLDLNSAISQGPVKRSMATAAGAFLTLLLMAILLPGWSSTAIQRLIKPFSAPAWPKWVVVELDGAVPERVAAGAPLEVRMRLSRGDKPSRKAILRFVGTGSDASAVQQQYMTRGEDGVYFARIDPRLASDGSPGHLRIQIVAGDATLTLPEVTVVPRLAITGVRATVQPPAYADLPVRERNLSEGAVTVVEGSTVGVRVRFNKPLLPDSASFRAFTDNTPLAGVAFTTAGPDEAEGTFRPGGDVGFKITATDQDGLSNAAMEEYRVVVRPDRLPIVQIEEPTRSEERTIDSVVRLKGIVEDDLGIATVGLSVQRLADQRTWAVPLVLHDGPGEGLAWEPAETVAEAFRHRLQYAWSLRTAAPDDLKPGDLLEYALVATDRFELDGKTHPPVFSSKLRILIVSPEQFAAAANDELHEVGRAIDQLGSAQSRSVAETHDLAATVRDKPSLDAADKAVAERLASGQSTAASQARQLSSRLEQLLERIAQNNASLPDVESAAKDAAGILKDSAEDPIRQAGASLGEATAATDPAARDRAMDASSADQQRAAEGLKRAAERIGVSGTLADAIDNVRKILDEQAKLGEELTDAGRDLLGKRPEDLNDAERKTLDGIAGRQERLAKATDQMAQQARDDAGRMSRSDPSTAESLTKAAEQAKQQNVSGNQRQAADSAKQNKQSQAAAAQKNAEVGLQVILTALRDAEVRKLEELQTQLAELQKQIDGLVRRQAGHALDNLQIQEADAVSALDPARREQLTQLSQRPEPPTEAARLPTVTAAQEQTERNARDLAGTTETVTGGAAVAALITRAASRMERAIVHLRASELPPAFDPPQTDALATLLRASELVRQQQQEAAEQIQARSRESIRSRYEQIRVTQQGVNDTTVAIDQSPRGDDGSRRRQDAVRLNRLAPEQVSLAERVAAVEQDVADAGGVVYVWANRDLVRVMTESADGLTDGETGKPVQDRQASALAQLDAMIRNLAIKPMQKRFESRGGGGGGGGAGKKPALPSEAELRLLRDLQVSLNDATVSSDTKPVPVDRVKSLGGRQGELRSVLGEMIDKATEGKSKLGPEPDPADQLPEEAGNDDVQDQELQQDLLGGTGDQSDEEAKANRVGDRMARSRQRLSDQVDPGEVTQIIQKRILDDLDQLIEEARNSEAESSPSPSPGEPGEEMARPDPGKGSTPSGQQQANAASTPAGQSSAGSGGATASGMGKDIEQSLAEWGRTTPRLRQAILDGAGEVIIEKYRGTVEEYYRSIGRKAAER